MMQAAKRLSTVQAWRTLALVLGSILLTVPASHQRATAAAGGGSIVGRVHLSGPAPGNPVIRMLVDPMCGKINAGKRVVDEIVAADREGGLANVFVSIRGSFPATPAPSTPVVVDQQGCLYTPRVVGVRVGQVLEVRSSDGLLHNVHTMSAKGNSFNVSIPKAGMAQRLPMKAEETMLRVRCDIHSWMTAFVGVIPHDYFTVSRAGGAFQIDGVPVGTQTVEAWHERFGVLTQRVQVTAGRVSAVDFTFSGTEKPPKVVPPTPSSTAERHVMNNVFDFNN